MFNEAKDKALENYFADNVHSNKSFIVFCDIMTMNIKVHHLKLNFLALH
jgi:hypothetical protein